MMTDSKGVDYESTALRLSSVFQPAAPINSDELFRGRIPQVRAVVDAINQPGRHAIVFGGRGVGKTSLGHILRTKLTTTEPVPIIAPLITCDSSDNYSTIWSKVFSEIDYLNGEIIRTARKNNIPVPVNTFIVDLVNSLLFIRDNQLAKSQ